MELPQDLALQMEDVLVPLKAELLLSSEEEVHSPASLALASLEEEAAPASVLADLSTLAEAAVLASVSLQLQWVSPRTPKMMTLLRCLPKAVPRTHAYDLVVKENADLVDLGEHASAAQ